MAKTHTYADALKVLGQDDSRVLDFAEKFAEGGLAALGVPGASAGAEVVRMGRKALTGIREKITGISRMDRTERVAAAYSIVVGVSVFEALDEVLQDSPAGLRVADLRMSAEEQLALAERFLSSEISGRGPAFNTHTRWATVGQSAALAAGSLRRFLSNLAAWQELDDTTRAAAEESIEHRLPDLAERRANELYRRLAADVPEFGVWANMAAHDVTVAHIEEVGTGLVGLRDLLEEMDSQRPVDRRRGELSAVYRSALQRRVLRSSDAPAEVTLPTLESAYLQPRGRFSLAGSGDVPSSERWWREIPLHDDLQALLAGMLTFPEVTESPIVILGHPGAGKSVLTEMLAARLSTADFFALRVELRAVPPNAPIHTQIETGVAATLNTAVQWRTLAESAGGALPVIILDGFDELLQASGVNRSDYLEQVQEFQRRQEALGQPVAVIVTSRTVVADRARFPEQTAILRLEPFDDRQIGRMVAIWNTVNEAAYAARGLQPPTAQTLLPYRELAEQPLLLLMLLVYDAEDSALQRSGGELSRSELYERLLTMFAEREVRKHHANLSGVDMTRAVEDELHRLEIVAIAMFVRQRQSVGAAELDHDLAALMPDSSTRPADADLHGAVSDAHQVLGRFFFVHESQAQVESHTASVFEFLHATFGEYLVARAVTAELAEILAARQYAARRRRAAPPMDDGLLYALTSYSLLASSAATIEFTQDLIDRRLADGADDRAEYRALLIDMFREAPYPPAVRSYTEYQPVRVPIADRQAAYTANLILLLTRVAPEGLELTDLFAIEQPGMALHTWRGLAGQWRALPNSQWHGLLDAIRLRHFGYLGDSPRSVLFPWDPDETEVNVGECIGFDLNADARDPLSLTDPYSVTVAHDVLTAGLLRSASVRINGTAARLTMVLLPYLANVSDEPMAWLEDAEEGTMWAEAHDALELRLGLPSADPSQRKKRLRRYERLLATPVLGAPEALVLRQAAEDLNFAVDRELGWTRDVHFADAGAAEWREYAQALERVVIDHLQGVDEIAPSGVSSTFLPGVLDTLRRRLDGPMFDQAVEHIMELLDTGGSALEQGSAPAPGGREELPAFGGGARPRRYRRRGAPTPPAPRRYPRDQREGGQPDHYRGAGPGASDNTGGNSDRWGSA